jgi:hypothetical protein
MGYTYLITRSIGSSWKRPNQRKQKRRRWVRYERSSLSAGI